MKDIPIIFSAPMVRAFLEGRKTMTRRLAERVFIKAEHSRDGRAIMVPSPWTKVQPGDRLWVRENWKPHSTYAGMKPSLIPPTKIFYAADESYAPSNTPWVPCIHMPRWASRLTLTVTATKIERVQDISHDDAVAEGVGIFPHSMSAQKRFGELWRSLHGADSWDANPEVVALTFTVHKQNIDAMPKEVAA